MGRFQNYAIAWILAGVFVLVLTGSAFSQDEKPLVLPDAAESIERLIFTLEDGEQRDHLTKSLRALLAASQVSGERTGEGAAERLNDHNSIIAVADQHAKEFYGLIDTIGQAFAELWNLPAWLEQQAQDYDRREFWIEIASNGLALPILVALLARWAVGLAFRQSVQRLRDSDPRSLRDRIFTGFARGVLEVSRVGGVLGAGFAVLHLVDRSAPAHQVAEFLILAIAVQTSIGVMARLVFSPHADALRPVPLSAEGSAYLYLWVMRLALVGTVGFVAHHVAVPLGASAAGATAIKIFAAIIVASLAMILLLQSRDAVSAVIGRHDAGPIRRRLAEIWHVLAILYILVLFAVFVSGTPDGFLYIIRSTTITVISIVVAIVASRLLARLLEKMFELDTELDQRFPGLRERSNLYRPILKRVLDTLLSVLVLFIVLDGWELGVIQALSPEMRAGILKSAGTISLVLILSVIAWEFASGAIARALSGTNPDGSPRDRGSRARTLLPLLRRAILISLVIFGGLIILAEIGIDIAPLLAGAGVVGLAIGFGSQALVRDIITGLFILIENTIAVGDYVTVGGHSGVVEDLSIRTIRLRDVSGTVHTVPFGDVTTVENFTKEFSFAVMDIGVAYKEDTDRVSDVLLEVFKELMADPEWGVHVLEPIQIMGVHELADSAVIIRARIKTVPMAQWSVRREYYRRMKKRFDKLGIDIPFPHTTVYFGEDLAPNQMLEHTTRQTSPRQRAVRQGEDFGEPE